MKNHDLLEDTCLPNESSAKLFNLSNFEEKDISIFLYTIFQYYLEKSVALIKESTQPSVSKAKFFLHSLDDNSFINNLQSHKITFNSVKGLVYFYLGLAHFTLEEREDAEKAFRKCIDFFNTLPTIFKLRYINVYQQAFNNLGILMFDCDDMKASMQYFAKAEQMYKVFCEMNSVAATCDFSEFFTNFFSSETMPSKAVNFNFFIDGGLNKSELEDNYTMTLFFLAQAYGRLDQRNKSMKYICHTLKRQVEFDKYVVEDVVNNCITLCGYFKQLKYYAQMEYLLLAALKLNDQEKGSNWQENKARVNLEMGNYYLTRLNFVVEQKNNQYFIETDDDLKQKLHTKIFSFDNLSIKWPKIEDVTDLEQGKSLFRLGNTQLKHAAQYFVMDGFVSENIVINQNISRLYASLCELETSEARVLGMHERRFNLLEPIYLSINPKSYPVQWEVDL